MRHLGLLLLLVFAYPPTLTAQAGHLSQRASAPEEFAAGSQLLPPHPLRPQGIPPELLPTQVRSPDAGNGFALPEPQRSQLDPLNGAKWGALVGGAAFGGLALLLVASDGNLSGDEAANAGVHAIAGALTGALVGLIVGAVAGA